MKLGICCKCIEPWAGISQSLISQYRYLERSQSIKPYLIYGDVKGFRINKNTIRLKNMPWSWWKEKNLKKAIFRVCIMHNKRLVKKIGLNVIQVEYPPLTELFDSFKGLKTCRFYGNTPLYLFKERAHVDLQKIVTASYLNFVKKSDFVLPISNFLVDEIKDLNQNIYTIKLGIDTNFYRPMEKEAYKKTKVLLHIGKFTHYKGVHELIDIFYKILKSEPDSFLWLVGIPFLNDKDYIDMLKNRVKQLKLQKKVYFSQRLPQETMPLVYNMCDIFTSCSHWEGYGLPWMEAQACGKPAIGWNVAALPEVIRNGRTGYLVDENDQEMFAEKVLSILQEKRLKASWGRSARELALENDAAIMGRNLENFYKKLI